SPKRTNLSMAPGGLLGHSMSGPFMGSLCLSSRWVSFLLSRSSESHLDLPSKNGRHNEHFVYLFIVCRGILQMEVVSWPCVERPCRLVDRRFSDVSGAPLGRYRPWKLRGSVSFIQA